MKKYFCSGIYKICSVKHSEFFHFKTFGTLPWERKKRVTVSEGCERAQNQRTLPGHPHPRSAEQQMAAVTVKTCSGSFLAPFQNDHLYFLSLSNNQLLSPCIVCMDIEEKKKNARMTPELSEQGADSAGRAGVRWGHALALSQLPEMPQAGSQLSGWPCLQVWAAAASSSQATASLPTPGLHVWASLSTFYCFISVSLQLKNSVRRFLLLLLNYDI